MSSRDNYYNKLSEIADSIEEIYQLKQQNQLGVSYNKLGISTVIDYVRKQAEGMDSAQLGEYNLQVGRYTVLLAYLMERLSFFQKYEFSFESYPYLDIIADILIQFVRRNTITSDSLRQVNKIIEIMQDIDTKYVKFRFSLSYRYLRLFVLLILYRNYLNASIIAKMLLGQMIVEGE